MSALPHVTPAGEARARVRIDGHLFDLDVMQVGRLRGELVDAVFAADAQVVRMRHRQASGDRGRA